MVYIIDVDDQRKRNSCLWLLQKKKKAIITKVVGPSIWFVLGEVGN
jgi:hypothetical protein